jgi:hypothetical protein
VNDAALLDALGRTPIASMLKQQIAQALALIPDGKRGALIVIGNEDGGSAHLAAKLGDKGDWKVAGGVGARWHGAISGSVVVLGAW